MLVAAKPGLQRRYDWIRATNHGDNVPDRESWYS